MNVYQLIDAFATIDCTVDVVRTGHPDHQRGFIIGPDGVTYGRATIYQRELGHIKWYNGAFGDRENWRKGDFIFWSFTYLMQTGEVLSIGRWLWAWSQACRLADEDLRAKEEWRRLNPKLDADGDVVRRRHKLEGRNPRVFLHQTLLPCQN